MAGTKGDGYHHGDLRDALIREALELIREDGVQGLSLRKCARRVGVSHAAPYRHFPTKDALLVAIAGEGFVMLRDAGLAAMEGIAEPRDRLEAYGVAYVLFALDHPEHHEVMFSALFEVPGSSEDDPEGAFALLRDTAAEAAGPDEDPLEAALAVWGLVHGLSMLILRGRIPPEYTADADAVERLTRASFAHWRR